MQIVQISSTMGSIGSLQKILRSDGEQYSQVGRYALPYRCSKAALNMGARLSEQPILIPCRNKHVQGFLSLRDVLVIQKSAWGPSARLPSGVA